MVRHLCLCREHQFDPLEAFRLGIFSPGFDTAHLNEFLSRKRTTRLQESLNPHAMAPLLRNKAIFHRQCIACGLPAPRLYGLFSHADRRLHAICNGAWTPVIDKEAFASSLVGRFAIKPIVGTLGRGVRIITRTPDGFRDHDGLEYDTRQFLSLLADTSNVGTLVQEVVENHPDILSLSGVPGLQTVRVITLVGANDRVEILVAFLKTITSPHVVIDTFIRDLTGNLEVAIRLADGTLTEACYLDGSGRGIVVVDAHPITGLPFSGFAIPFWPQVCELARRAALAVLPVRAVGWDIAVMAQGPCLIEGNIWWDPPNQQRVMGHISERMKAVIADLT